MILHSPDVLNQLKKLGIKTIIDYSSKESTPLGRMEWIKLYGILTNKEEMAENIFFSRILKEKYLSLVRIAEKYADFGLLDSICLGE